MNIITSTIWGMELQTALLLGRRHVVRPKTSLNEKFDILPNEDVPEGNNPILGYITVGDRGHQVRTGRDNVAFTPPVNHRSKDGALFNHLPFVLRTPDDDLSIDRRENYRLRKEITVDGQRYIAYYAKALDLSNVAIALQYLVNDDGDTLTQDFTPTDDVLEPEPPVINSRGVITTNGDMLSVSAIIDTAFDDNDTDEYLNVARIMYGDENRAIISEVGFVTGSDIVTSASSPQGRFNYNEIVGAQIMSFLTGYNTVSANGVVGFQVDVGAAEPLIGTQPTSRTVQTSS